MATKAHRIFPHGLPEELAPGLWRVKGSLAFPLPRNMLIYRLSDASLLLYSVVALNDEGMAALEKLGRPSVMVVPHKLHVMDAAFYKARYPELQIIGPTEAAERKPELQLASPSAHTHAGVTFHSIPGGKCGELVMELLLPTGKALIFTDLVGQHEGKSSLVLKILGAPGGSGVARVVKWRQIADKAQVRTFLHKMADLPSLQLVIGCHGGPVKADCAAWLTNAAAGL